MPKFSDSHRGYSFEVHKRDHFHCRYCGLDGTRSFENWVSLSRDHLLPQGDPRRESREYIVTACMFCNNADNRYHKRAEARGLKFENMSPDELVDQRRRYVETIRANYLEFWEKSVKNPDAQSHCGQREIMSVLNSGEIDTEPAKF